MTVQLLILQASLTVVAGVVVTVLGILIRRALRQLGITAGDAAASAGDAAAHAKDAADAVAGLDGLSTASWRTGLEQQLQGLANGRSTEAARAARVDLRVRQLEAFAESLTEAMHNGSELPKYNRPPEQQTGLIGL